MAADDPRATRARRRRAARGAAPAPPPPDDWLATPESAPVPAWRALWAAHRVPWCVLFALALAVRVLVLAGIARSPYIEVGTIDSEAYLAWAEEIATRGWRPTGLFYQSPLYAWYLAGLRELLGPSTWPPRIGQVLLGSLAPPLVYAIGTRVAAPAVGWLAGVGLALYGPLVLEEVTLSKTSLLVTSVLAGFALYLRAAPVARAGGLFAAGLLFGVTVLGVAQWVLGFLALAAYAPALAPGLPRARRARAAGAFVLGGVLVVAPVAAWNSAHAGGLVLTSGGAGLNFFIGNNPDATGLPGKPSGLRDVPLYEEADSRRLAEADTGRPMGEAAVSRYWVRRALAFIAENPRAYLALVGKKVAVLWNAYEVPDNYHYAFVRAEFVPALAGLLTFALVGPLALVGLVLPVRGRRQLGALYLVTASILATLLVFYVRGRYRIAAVPFLVVFAALAVDRLRRAAAAGDRRGLALRAGLLVVAFLFVNRTYCDPPARAGGRPLCLAGDTWFDAEWLKIMEGYERRRDFEPALAAARRSVECSTPRRPGAGDFAIGTAAARSAVVHHQRGEHAPALERVAESEAHFARAVAIGYRVDDAFFNRLLLLGKLGLDERLRAAAAAGRGTGALDHATLARVALTLEREGHCDGAVAAVATVDPDVARQVRARCAPRRE